MDLKRNQAHNFIDLYFLCLSFHLKLSNMSKTKYIGNTGQVNRRMTFLLVVSGQWLWSVWSVQWAMQLPGDEPRRRMSSLRNLRPIKVVNRKIFHVLKFLFSKL